MTDFFTKIFIAAWNIILITFSIGSIGALVVMYYEGKMPEPKQLALLAAYWFGIAVALGAMSLVISAYLKLCRLVELKEPKRVVQAKPQKSASFEKIEPTI